MYLFVSGALMAGFFVASIFFWRYWWRTRSPFFALFALAWLLLGVERAALAALNAPEEPYAGVYLLRLGAFLLILAAIILRNRRELREK